jgi:uncharacterized membrane protein
MRDRRYGSYFIISFIFILIIAWGMPMVVPSAWSDEEKEKKDLPPRGISIALEHPGVIISQGDDVSIDLDVTNGGRQDENIKLSIPSVPKGWKARVKTYSFEINSVHVKSDKSKSLTFKADADEDIAPGDYTFLINAKTEDGALKSSSKVIITVEKKVKEKKTKGINITTSYPVLQGPTDSKFEFSIEVENKLDKDTLFNLSAQGPKDWEINFKPAYEDKFISSLRIKKDASQTMAVEVKPYPWAEAGSYPILVKVSSEDAKAEVKLAVVLKGTYKLEAGTADGLLSLNAYQGKPANISFYVKNNGSATHNTVKFLSFKPENWKVEFKPERLESLAPGDLKQVEMTITSADQALVGDYSVSLRVEGEKSTKDMEFRVTVRASTVWGWIGIGIIVLVIAGLVVLFIRLGRR